MKLKNINSVLLIVAPNIYSRSFFSYLPPLGILYIASALEQANVKVKVLDTAVKKMGYFDIIEEIKKIKPDLVGITCTTETRFEFKELTENIYKYDPNIFIVGGGAHVTFCSEETLKFTKTDLVVLGEGENAMVELINGKPLEEIKGIVYQVKGRINVNARGSRIADLDSLGFPARHLIDMSEYPGFSVRREKNTHINTNRGCPFGCVYCSASKLWGMKSMNVSAEKVIEEIEMLIDSYDIRLFYFYDDMFTANKKRAERICTLIMKKKLDIHWGTSTRIDSIDKDLLCLMGKAGCVQINYGVETLNEKVCGNIGRKAALSQVDEIINSSLAAGIENVQVYILIGLPGDSTFGLQKTVSDLLSTQATMLAVQILRIYPGTDLERLARQRNILTADFSWYQPYNEGMPELPTVPLYTEQSRKVLIEQYEFLRLYLRVSTAIRRRLPKTVLKIYARIDCLFFNLVSRFVKGMRLRKFVS